MEKKKRGRPRKLSKIDGDTSWSPQLAMENKKRGRPRKSSKIDGDTSWSPQLAMENKKRGRPRKSSKIDGDPSWSPWEFLSTSSHDPPATPRYPIRHQKGVFANGDDPTLTLSKKFPVEKTESLSPTTVHLPTMDNLNSNLHLQIQVSNNLAAEQLKGEENSLSCYEWLENGGEITENLNDLLDIEKPTSDLHQSHAQEKLNFPAAAPPPTHEVVIHHHLWNSEATVACRNGREEVLPKNLVQKAAPTQSLNLNLSDMAAMSYDNSSDDEVHSTLDVSLVTVKGYRVKEKFAPLLRQILSKFGDIAKDSSLKSMRLRSLFLETVCGIFQNLNGTKFTEITSTDLKCMLDDIKDIESVRLEVGWLRLRLEEIKEAKLLQKGSPSLKREKTRINEAIEKADREVERYKAGMKMLLEKISLVGDKLAAMKSESEKINRTALDTTTKVKCFYKRSLVDGLL